MDDFISKKTKGAMKLFFFMVAKAKLPYLWIIAYIAASMWLTRVGIQVTEYTSKLYSGKVSFTGVIAPFLIYTLASLCLGTVAGILSGLCSSRINRNLRRELWTRIVRLPFAFYQKNEPQELISRITTDVASVSQLIMQVFVQFITTAYATWAIFERINSYNTNLMIALIILLPLQIVIAVLSGRMRFGLGDRVNMEQASLTQSVSERAKCSMLIKSCGTEQKEEERVRTRIKELYRVVIKNSWVGALTSPAYAIVGVMQFILLTLVGRHFYQTGAISLPQWVAFFAFANQLINNLTAYTGYWISLRATQGLTLRLSGIMNETAENVKTGEDISGESGLSGDIEVCDVTFGYDGKTIFDNLNVTIPQGKMTAIVGRSGSGKTTLLNLIMRLYSPESGNILIGGTDIETYNKKSWRNAIAYITQETVLFTGTIRENLVMGLNREVDDWELDEVCAKAGADGFIQLQPQLYETQVTENGSAFSGGERQKLAIARALLQNTEYFILDEGIAALDTGAKAHVLEMLHELKEKNRTVIYAAHDVQSLMDAEYIIIMDEGRVLDMGDAEIMRRNSMLNWVLEEVGI